MSRKKLIDRETDADVDMTPMLDIVFILLIFFIVTTSFVKELAIEANKSQKNEGKVSSSNSIYIEITAQEQIWLSYANKPKRLVDLERVEANIERALAEQETQNVIIKADYQVRHEVVFTVMDHIKATSDLQINIMTVD
ncbi:ExbD/TolR family protein [Pseudoalteromonas denitrificans]|uniref:Outer membrane transport energization protein ExbD n=1 Tax=Pseudoalteromonas denitrificans DSM 6059 TaxID=1123010 RepID=A0A1I1M2A5_9GAMM|nr:biopolymer transporter ExbD [Pseudoalteromonas denitrificans]SFC75790.1 outer membrane transport energization protein ExbD [Pseudoalteromonas denitrificans DSM 6059]